MKRMATVLAFALLIGGCANTMSEGTKNDICGMTMADPTGVGYVACKGAFWIWPGEKMPQSDLKPKCGVEGCPDPADHYPSSYK